jgi:hypothetical protein
MPAGVPTSAEKIAEFRAHYLYSGSPIASGRATGLAQRTAYDIAERLEGEPDFAADRKRLREQALDRLVAMRMRVAEKAAERFEEDLPEVFADNVTIIDKRADYGRLVMDAEKNAQHLAKIESGNDPDNEHKTEVHIHLKGVDESAEVTPDGED